MTISRRTLIIAASAGAAVALAGCNNLATLNRLNALTPGDGGIVKRIDGAAYGSDQRQRLDVYAPADATAPLPVVIFFYGGGWNSGYRGGYAFAARAIAARGFVVVVPDYRLVPQVRFPAFIDDGAAAVRWTVDHIAASGGDPKRIAVAGHSAGAHIAMMLALDGRYIAAAGASGAIKAVVGLAGPYDFLPFDQPSAIAAFGKAPDPRATQPISFVRADAPPALLLTGDADDVVRPRNSRALAAALRLKGAKVEEKEYPGVGHVGLLLALSKPFRGKADVLDTMTSFLRRTLPR
ncbi:alpha/beta hydrolase [Polymorphobacter sp. PAMC 29334]|uniref:alpha/beta hydrolase n=1 Tax=Polymorphobacter sp. PAMC 29334 TaxID=2862331 RepID=UPI001C685A17|nr:alpha/beta hydrolase [Polymorphobacter sp. PAMC 29334]QYE34211.1 alpha/beta hydrolase [Polymorphobacter sp. PAMC 29334]